MNDEPKVFHLKDLVPKSVDDIIRAHRDECQLAWATDDDLEHYKSDLLRPDVTVRHVICNWNILMVHLTLKGGATSVPFLAGAVQDTRQPWVTSAVEAVDLAAGLVKTKNSLYRIVGPRDPAPDAHTLMHICVWLNSRGIGQYLGVPGFFY